MHTCIIANPHAGSADGAASVRRRAAQHDQVVWWESPDRAACEGLVQRAVEAGAVRIAAAGGDGTINGVVNALQAIGADVPLGVLPFGTGNDLAHTLAIPHDPDAAWDVLLRGHEQVIDLFRMDTSGERRFGINVAAGGFSGQVDEALTSEAKATWGPLAYLLGAAQVLPDLQEYETYIAFDGAPRQRMEVLNVVVANGRTAAGGRPVAPIANPCDGLLDVIVVKAGSMPALAKVGTRLVAGNYLGSPLVHHRRVRQVAVASDPGMWFNVDGELITNEPVSLCVLPGRQRVIVGPEFEAAPDESRRDV